MLFRFLNGWLLSFLLFCLVAETAIYQLFPVYHHSRNLAYQAFIISTDSLLMLAVFVLFNSFKTPNGFIKSLYCLTIILLTLFTWLPVLFLYKTGSFLDISLIHYSLLNFSEVMPVALGSLRYVHYWLLLFVLANLAIFFLAKKLPASILERQSGVRLLLFVLLINVPLQVYFHGISKEKISYQGMIINTVLYKRPFRDYENIKAALDIHDLSVYKNVVLQESAPKTIVFLVLESFREDLFTQYKDEVPFLHELQQQGRYFSNTYTTVSHSSKALFAVFCGTMPSLAMSIQEATSRYNNAYCLPNWFAEHGYSTAFIQSADGEFENRHTLVNNLGFREFIDGEDLQALGAKELGYFSQDDALLLPAVEKWLGNNSDHPVFLAVFNSNTHHPYDLANDKCHGDDKTCYLKAVRYYDAVLRKIVASIIQKRGLDNTLFVIFGDHGEAFGEKIKRQHDGVSYEEVVHVPLLFYGANIAAGEDSALRSLLDIAPTIMETYGSGLVVDSKVMGKNLWQAQGHETLVNFCWYDRACMAIRDSHHKWVVDLNTGRMDNFGIRNGQVDETKVLPSDSIDMNKVLDFAYGMKAAIYHYHDTRFPVK